MKSRYSQYSLALAVAAALSGCGSSSTPSSSPGNTAGVVTIPGVNATTTFSFDLGVFDGSSKKYFVTDRTNKAITVIDLNTGLTVSQFKPGFTGCGGAMVPYPGFIPATGIQNVAIPTCANTAAGVFPSFTINNDQTGPDGVDVVGANLYVGDVGHVWVLNKTTGALVVKLNTFTPTVRADEGCFDPDDNIYGIATPGAPNPYMTFIDTTNNAVIADVIMDQPAGTPSAGLEACVYDTATKMFFVNNDGSTVNGRGELDGIPAARIVALKPGGPAGGPPAPANRVQFSTLAGIKTYSLMTGANLNCDPTGVALGPGNDIGAMCRQGDPLAQLTFQILDKTTGTVLAILNAGGGDQIAYDAPSNNWFLGTSRWTPAGTSCGAGSAACPLTPVVTVVNGASRTVTARSPSGNNSHSIATGAGLVFSPFTNGPSATAGGVGFPNGGVALFTTQ